MTDDLTIIGKLNDIAWHSWQLNRLTDELNGMGISDDDIDAYLGDYDRAVKAAAAKVMV